MRREGNNSIRKGAVPGSGSRRGGGRAPGGPTRLTCSRGRAGGRRRERRGRLRAAPQPPEHCAGTAGSSPPTAGGGGGGRQREKPPPPPASASLSPRRCLVVPLLPLLLCLLSLTPLFSFQWVWGKRCCREEWWGIPARQKTVAALPTAVCLVLGFFFCRVPITKLV